MHGSSDIPQLVPYGAPLGRGDTKDLEEAKNTVSTLAQASPTAVENALHYHSPTEPTHDFSEIVGKSYGLTMVLKQVAAVGSTDSTALSGGETGNEKVHLAKAIHNLRSRRNRLFVRSGCAAIPAELLENELFGHEKGAFTGAVSRGIGRFALGTGG